jgi:HSP20 family protein
MSPAGGVHARGSDNTVRFDEAHAKESAMNCLVRSRSVTNPAFDRLLGQVLSDPFFGEGRASAGNGAVEQGTLALDISEDEASFYVRASLPGFRKEDVDASVHEGILTIKAEHAEVVEEKKEQYHRRERRTGSLHRRIRLPDTVDGEKIGAHLADGVLTLTLPKTPKNEPRKITIG